MKFRNLCVCLLLSLLCLVGCMNTSYVLEGEGSSSSDESVSTIELISGIPSSISKCKLYYLEPNLKVVDVDGLDYYNSHHQILVRTMTANDEPSEYYYLDVLGSNSTLEAGIIETKLTDSQLTEYNLKRSENSSYTIQDYRKEIGLD